jgi:hypothetical protein
MPEAGSLIQLLLARLERISADSPLSHRASGVRGALLRSLDEKDADPAGSDAGLRLAVDTALDILGRAAAALRAGRRPHP